MAVIYKIFNIHNGKFIIGSTITPQLRWTRHKSKARCGKHINRYFQFEWNKYGESAFKFEILEIVDGEKKLLDCEQDWLDAIFEHPLCMNLNPNASKPISWKGKKRPSFSIEHRRKIGEASSKMIRTKESNNKRRKAMESRMEPFTLINSLGNKIDCFGFRPTAQILKLDYRHLISVVKGQRKSHKGWKLYVA